MWPGGKSARTTNSILQSEAVFSYYNDMAASSLQHVNEHVKDVTTVHEPNALQSALPLKGISSHPIRTFEFQQSMNRFKHGRRWML
jgi:hypothetical protein